MKVLIAEDDATSRRLLEACLQKWGYEVVAAQKGDEAWAMLQREDAPRLAVLDWMMPGMDGVQICREIRKGTAQSPVYILLLTTRNRPQDLSEALEAGVDDYLTKPFNPQELKARLHAGGRLLELQEQLREARRRLETEATRDSLTGLWNRTAILDMLRRELARAERGSSSVAVAFAELDDFDRFRQKHGAEAGDAVFREAAHRIRSSVRYYDSVGRYAPEKLLLVVPDCDAQGAQIQAERLRALIGKKPFETPAGKILLTLSVSVGAKREAKERDADAILRAAEAALARAKSEGGDRVEIARAEEIVEDAPPPLPDESGPPPEKSP